MFPPQTLIRNVVKSSKTKINSKSFSSKSSNSNIVTRSRLAIDHAINNSFRNNKKFYSLYSFTPNSIFSKFLLLTSLSTLSSSSSIFCVDFASFAAEASSSPSVFPNSLNRDRSSDSSLRCAEILKKVLSGQIPHSDLHFILSKITRYNLTTDAYFWSQIAVHIEKNLTAYTTKHLAFITIAFAKAGVALSHEILDYISNRFLNATQQLSNIGESINDKERKTKEVSLENLAYSIEDIALLFNAFVKQNFFDYKFIRFVLSWMLKLLKFPSESILYLSSQAYYFEKEECLTTTSLSSSSPNSFSFENNERNSFFYSNLSVPPSNIHLSYQNFHLPSIALILNLFTKCNLLPRDNLSALFHNISCLLLYAASEGESLLSNIMSYAHPKCIALIALSYSNLKFFDIPLFNKLANFLILSLPDKNKVTQAYESYNARKTNDTYSKKGKKRYQTDNNKKVQETNTSFINHNHCEVAKLSVNDILGCRMFNFMNKTSRFLLREEDDEEYFTYLCATICITMLTWRLPNIFNKDLITKISEYIPLCTSFFTNHGLSSIVYAYATLKYNDIFVLTSISNEIKNRLKIENENEITSFLGRDIANLCNSFAKLKFMDLELFRLFSIWLSKHFNLLENMDYVALVFSYAKLNYRDMIAFFSFSAYFSSNFQNLSLSQLATVLSSYARLKIRDDTLYRRIADYIVLLINNDGHANKLVEICKNIKDDKILRINEQKNISSKPENEHDYCITKKKREKKSQLKKKLNYYLQQGSIDISSHSLFKSYNVSQKKLQEMVTILSAFSRMKIIHKELFSKAECFFIDQRLKDLNSTDIREIIVSYSRVNYFSTRLMNMCIENLSKDLYTLNNNLKISLLISLRKLRMFPLNLVKDIHQQLLLAFTFTLLGLEEKIIYEKIKVFVKEGKKSTNLYNDFYNTENKVNKSTRIFYFEENYNQKSEKQNKDLFYYVEDVYENYYKNTYDDNLHNICQIKESYLNKILNNRNTCVTYFNTLSYAADSLAFLDGKDKSKYSNLLYALCCFYNNENKKIFKHPDEASSNNINHFRKNNNCVDNSNKIKPNSISQEKMDIGNLNSNYFKTKMNNELENFTYIHKIISAVTVTVINLSQHDDTLNQYISFASSSSDNLNNRFIFKRKKKKEIEKSNAKIFSNFDENFLDQIKNEILQIKKKLFVFCKFLSNSFFHVSNNLSAETFPLKRDVLDKYIEVIYCGLLMWNIPPVLFSPLDSIYFLSSLKNIYCNINEEKNHKNMLGEKCNDTHKKNFDFLCNYHEDFTANVTSYSSFSSEFVNCTNKDSDILKKYSLTDMVSNDVFNVYKTIKKLNMKSSENQNCTKGKKSKISQGIESNLPNAIAINNKVNKQKHVKKLLYRQIIIPQNILLVDLII